MMEDSGKEGLADRQKQVGKVFLKFLFDYVET